MRGQYCVFRQRKYIVMKSSEIILTEKSDTWWVDYIMLSKIQQAD